MADVSGDRIHVTVREGSRKFVHGFRTFEGPAPVEMVLNKNDRFLCKFGKLRILINGTPVSMEAPITDGDVVDLLSVPNG